MAKVNVKRNATMQLQRLPSHSGWAICARQMAQFFLPKHFLAPRPFLLLLGCLFGAKNLSLAQGASLASSEWSEAPAGGTLTKFVQSAVAKYLPMALAWEERAPEPRRAVAENLIVVTADGLRWQEVFRGVPLMSPLAGAVVAGSNDNEGLAREDLMPFFWKTLAGHGQVYGNRMHGNEVRVANRMRISYPGYSEILCGYPDDSRIVLNSKKQNPNRTVFEWLNHQRRYCGRVAVFGSWELFPYIFNETRSGIPVNAGFEPIQPRGSMPLTAEQKRLNDLLDSTPRRWEEHVRPDTLTWAFAKEHLERRQPRVVFLGFGETDEFAHEGNAAGYLQAIARFDSLLGEIWRFIESNDHYRGKTALLITTDHGRGRNNWRAHNPLAPGSEETWFAVASPDIEAKGEVRSAGHIRHEQFAQLMLRLLGLDHDDAAHPMAPAPEVVFEKSKALFALPQVGSGVSTLSGDVGLGQH
ncbi:MAG: alkaline phosphatase family protein [Saprospiraceae bacterium]